MIRIFLFIALIYFAVALPAWLFFAASFLYVLLYNHTYELLVLGAIVDAVFGLTSWWVPYYTLLLFGLMVCGEFIRPLVQWAND